jgi:DNA-3-methyladenine glycosylase I
MNQDIPEGLIRGTDGKLRCGWVGHHAKYQDYHDSEWGRPLLRDRDLFEKISLEGFQAGLSWLTILRKRENFRAAFDNFDLEKIAQYGDADVERLMQDTGIVRNRRKILAVINNAQRLPELQAEFGSFFDFLKRYQPEPNSRPDRADYATIKTLTQTPESQQMSRDLKRRGWAFVGPTTLYAFMQGLGLVNDHIEGCWQRKDCE